MTFTSPMTAVTGATFTAAQFNTNVRDNLNAIWVGSVAGDIDYYTSSNAKTRLAIGSALQKLRVNAGGTAPEWATELFSAVKRQGGSSSTWSGTGTTSYTPALVKLQLGALSVTSSGGTASVSVTFPDAFSNAPIVLFNISSIGNSGGPLSVSSSGFTTTLYYSSTSTFTMSLYWLAIGPP